MDMAPILILALIFASCDDRGSTPSGGSDLTVTIDLPTRTDYPASAGGFSVAMPSKDGLAYASSVTYTAAAGESPATLVATGFSVPKEGLAPYAIVSFESTAFGLMATGQIALTGVIGMGPSSPVLSSDFKTVPVITVTVQPSEAGAFPMPTAASDYALTFKSDGSSAIFTPNSDQVKITQGKAATEEPLAAAVKAQAVITVPQSFALGNLSAGTAYSVTMAGWSSDGNDYTAASGSLTYNLGSNLTVSMAASQIEYGSISITLPESFQSKAILGEDDEPATIKMSDVGTVSYSIKSSDGKEYSGTVSETAVKVPYGTYSVSISFSYGEIAFAATSASVTVSSSEATTATIQGDAVQAQVADITVSFGKEGAPSDWPTLASAYAVTYAEIKDGEAGAPVGYPVKNALTGAQFTIASSGLKVGSQYEVVVSFAGSDQDYRAVGTTGALVSIDSTSPAASTANAVTAYFKPLETVSVSGTATITGLTGAVISEGAISLTAADLDAATKANIASASIELSFESNSSAKVAGTVTLKESVQLSSVTSLVFENLSAQVGNATVSKVTITTADEEGALSASAAAVEATAVINVTGEITSNNYDNSASLTISSSSDLELTQEDLAITTTPSTASAANVVITLTAAQEGSISGTLTIDPSSAVNMTQLAWSNLNSGSGIEFGGKTIKSVTITGTYADGTFTLQSEASGLSISES